MSTLFVSIWYQVVVSLTFCELSKIISQKYTMPVINIYGENFKLKFCACAQSMALGTRTKFQLEMLIGSAISATHKFRENILESSRNVSETTPGVLQLTYKRSEGTMINVLAQLSSKVNMLRQNFLFHLKQILTTKCFRLSILYSRKWVTLASCRLKSSVTRLFVQYLAQAKTNKTRKRHFTCFRGAFNNTFPSAFAFCIAFLSIWFINSFLRFMLLCLRWRFISTREVV